MPIVDMFDYEDVTPIAQARANRSGRYPTELAHTLLKKSKEVGVDPTLAMALAMVESNFGTRHRDNPLRIVLDKHNVPEATPSGDQRDINLDYALRYLKQSMNKYPNDPELGIQAYNGLGYVGPKSQTYSGGWKGAYGKNRMIDTRKERPHGKAVLMHQQSLQKNPYIQALIAGLLNTEEDY